MSEVTTFPEKDGYTHLGDFFSTPSSSLEPQNVEIPAQKYREFSEPYLKVRPDYILAEGVGVHASYNLRGHIVVSGNTLNVSAMGRTAASRIGSVNWFVSAKILDGVLDIATQNLGWEGVSAWPNDDFTPIGHASFTLPMPPRRLTLQLVGGYFFSNGPGNLASGTTDISFDIEVEPV